MKFLSTSLIGSAALSTLLLSSAAFASNLSYTTYNPQKQGIFPVSSTLISGEKDAVLVDAQFSTKDAQNLIDMINKSGKNLTYIVISAGDPDYYFGLEPLVKAFPHAKVIATAKVVQHIKDTKDAKLAYWGPILKDGAPSAIVIPTITNESAIALEGKKIQIKSPNSYASYLWVPSTRTVLGGVGISSNIHVWTADTQSPQQRNQWRQTLKQIQNLQPTVVIPGHYLGKMPEKAQAVDFTYHYLVDVEQVLKDHQDSASVVKALKEKYPTLQDEDSLELSNKVLTHEMKW